MSNVDSKVVRLFPILNNIKPFIIKDHPTYHPETQEYMDYWEEQEKRCIEGLWAEDKKNNIGGWRYMSGPLYYYINFCVIEDEDEETNTTKVINPSLRDIEWIFFYNWLICRGFSGFENDEEFTSNLLVKKIENKELLTNKDKIRLESTKGITKEDGSYKKYINPREYLYQTHSKPLGRPLYGNVAKNLMALTSRRQGKCLNPLTQVLTDSGWKPMLNIKIGENVYGSDGKLCKVIDKTEIQKDLNFYKIKLRDGREIESCEDHLWKVWEKNKNKNKKESVYTVQNTKYIFENYLNKTSKESLIAIPLCKPINFNKKDLPIDPYFLGLYLGDGLKHRISITTKDEEIKDYIYDIANKYNNKVTINQNTNKTCPSYHITDGSYVVKGDRRNKKLLDKFINLNLLNNKHIPDIYLYNSYEYRLELLKGLMDTDGTALSTGGEFYSSNKTLAYNVYNLSNSLGFYTTIKEKKARIKDKEYNTCYRIRITTNQIIFKLTRKKNIQDPLIFNKKSTASRLEKVFIESVEKVENKNGICIAVNNNDNTYITKDYIVTHNSFWLMGIISHTFNFHGAVYFDTNYFNLVKGPEIVVGSVLGKSADMLKKFSFNQEYQKNNYGSYGENEEFIPGFFYQNTLGSLTVSNSKSPYRNEYEYVEGGIWKRGGKGTKIIHVTYQDNPEASVGTGPIISIVEEVGLVSNLLDVHKSNEATFIRKNKFGSALYVGCVCAGTKVWNAWGDLCNIESLKHEDGIVGFNKIGVSQENITYWQDPIEKPCYKITTSRNTILECSEDHPILWSKNDLKYSERITVGNKRVYQGSKKRLEFKEAKDIVVGDQVAVINAVNLFKNEPFWEPRTVGLLIGDGSYGIDQTPKLSNCDINILNYIESKFNTSIDRTCITKSTKEVYKELRIKGITRELRKLEIYGQTKNNKRLPKSIFRASRNDVCEFIGGFYDADGTISCTSKSKTISITSSCKELLSELKFLCVKLGIHGDIHEQKPKNRNRKIADKNSYFRFVIGEAESIINFSKNITLLCEHKADKLKELYNTLKKSNRLQVGVFTTRQEGDKRLINHLDVEGFKLERVKSVEYIGMKPVYNLTADVTNTYLANNIITHNTAGNMEKILEPKIIFEDPEAYDMLPFSDVWENRKKPIGLFLPAYYTDNTFRDENGNQDIEAAYEEEMYQRKKRSEADNSLALDGWMMSRPLIPSEMFLSATANVFPVSMLRDRLTEVEVKKIFEIVSFKGTLEWKNNKQEVKFVPDINNKLTPIIQTNLDQYKGNLKGSLVFYESPEEEIPDPTRKRSLYKIVYDPIRDDGKGTSLASILVYKGVSEDNWANGLVDDIVAEYIGRTDLVEDIHEIAIKLAIYYNAKIMVETNIPDFIRYCKRENKINLLQGKPVDAISKAVKNPGKKYDVGIDMTSPALHEHAEQLIRQWLLTPWKTLEDGITLLNLHKLKSPRLLLELIQYERSKNSDHVSSLKLLVLWLSQEKQTPIQKSSEVAKETLDNFFNKIRYKQNLNPYYNY